jgi:hypothetical protein
MEGRQAVTGRPTLSPEMLLFEIAAMCSRHGVPVSTDNPGAAVHHATQLMRTLGLTVPIGEPLAIEAPPEPEQLATTSVLPVVPDEPAAGDPAPGWNLRLPSTLAAPLPPRRPLDGNTFDRGRHRPGAPRSLQVVADDGA